MTKKVVDTRYAKSEDYKEILNAIEKTAKCPFCKENFKYHRKKILRSEKGWVITESSWPYKNTRFHFLIIPEEHRESFEELNSADFAALSELVKWAIKKYKLKGGGLALRFGDSLYTGATVCHLHFHLMVPMTDKKRKSAKVVYFGIG